MLFLLGAMLTVLTIGTVLYILHGDRGQAPIKLMSPSRFVSYEQIGSAIARRFWPQFQENQEIFIHVSPKIKNADLIINGLRLSLDQLKANYSNVKFYVSPLEDNFVSEYQWNKNIFHWTISPLYVTGEWQSEGCIDYKNWLCLEMQTSQRHHKKRLPDKQISALIEDHHDRGLVLFVHEPTGQNSSLQ